MGLLFYSCSTLCAGALHFSQIHHEMKQARSKNGTTIIDCHFLMLFCVQYVCMYNPSVYPHQ